ncbi:MAG: pyridoxine 5'-phosphate synthase [Kiritimatiellae bacterium]|nr:pyridoxine 5'-phosphate synthase [Kiritimatiellia bacterium]
MNAGGSARSPDGLRLGVNVDHIATLRQLRGTPYPDLLRAARACASAGAHGITVHLREDRRHIQDADVRALKAWGGLPLNLEMAAVPAMVEFALSVRPDEVCLVPERRAELTTEGGLDVAGRRKELAPVVRALQGGGIEVSLFIEPEPAHLEAAVEIGARCVELHTGRYCSGSPAVAAAELERLVRAAVRGHELGLRINAGHGIHLGNLRGILEIPYLDTLNIGHSLVCDAVFVGLEAAVRAMLEGMRAYRGGRR